jgi:hypothetical protein
MTIKRSKTKALTGVSPFIAEECPQPRKAASRRPARHIEDGEQVALMGWARRYRIVIGIGSGHLLSDYLYAVPNGGRRGKAEAARLKAAGVKAGVSDLHLPLPRGIFHGLWIELKAPKPHPSSTSTEQRAWLKRMREAGHRAEVCYGAADAIASIQAYLALGVGPQVRPAAVSSAASW